MAGDVSRRKFLKHTAGVGAAWMIGAPCVGRAAERSPAPTSDEVIGAADDRIKEYRKGRAVLRVVRPDGRPLPRGTRLQVQQRRHAFLFGCNIFKLDRCRTPEDSAAYADRFAELLNFATLPFYWWTYERQKGRPSDERTDQIVQWCRRHDITTKGHPLAWNYVDPRWLAGTSEEVMELQIERIARCMERFRNDIGIWDVVNEATHHDRDETKRNAPLLTEAISRMGVGAYIRAAYKAARAADPRATLIINDYRTDPAFEEKVISQLVDAEGRPLYDVIGIQSHMHGGYWGPARAWDVCDRFARFGKPIHFTETTLVSGAKDDSGWATTPEGEAQQARLAAEFYTVLFSHPAVEAITWWDFSDQDAWQGAPAGLIRADMSPKPAYETLRELIKGKWWTRSTVDCEADGRAKVEGFRGEYEITAKYNGSKLAGRFSLAQAATGPAEVRLGPAPGGVG
ncbi:MAG: endo-1,4-beta-xylanase [Planctomycetota bacterium]|nr:endo-1,4-beta-xylanase [Planctomycetota bacterium]